METYLPKVCHWNQNLSLCTLDTDSGLLLRPRFWICVAECIPWERHWKRTIFRARVKKIMNLLFDMILRLWIMPLKHPGEILKRQIYMLVRGRIWTFEILIHILKCPQKSIPIYLLTRNKGENQEL